MVLFQCRCVAVTLRLKPTHKTLWVSVGINVDQELRLNATTTEQVPHISPSWITNKSSLGRIGNNFMYFTS